MVIVQSGLIKMETTTQQPQKESRMHIEKQNLLPTMAELFIIDHPSGKLSSFC